MENKIVQNSKKRKFQRTLNGIEKGLWKRYKRNLLNNGVGDWANYSNYVINKEVPNHEKLIQSFNFEETPEGKDFWWKIYNSF